VLFVAEIISTEAEQRHFGDEWNGYAGLLVPELLVLDALTESWMLLSNPSDGAYTAITTGDFGEPIPVEVAGEPYPIDSGQFRWIGP
jgi:hypothetical protein